MFYIKYTLNPLRLTGLEALDFRRKLGLADRNFIATPGEIVPSYWRQGRIQVSEEFARKYFHKSAIEVNLYIDLEQLHADEMTEIAEMEGFVGLGNLSQERIESLYVQKIEQ